MQGVETVGITAGASAPEVLVDDVIDALRRLGPVEVMLLPGRRKTSNSACPPNSPQRRLNSHASGLGLTVHQKRKVLTMAVPFLKEMRIGAYLLKQKLMGRKRYPLVLMLEPLFRCNLACFGCGKIDYPDAILNKRLSVKECLDAVDECGAPMVAIPGGEPLIHKEIGEIVKGIVARKKFVSLCTNALLLEKKLTCSSRRPTCSSRCISTASRSITTSRCAWKAASSSAVAGDQGRQGEGLHRQRQLPRSSTAIRPRTSRRSSISPQELGVGVSISPGYAYERAPDQEHFLNRRKTKELFRDVFARGKGKNWNFMHSSLFLDFLAGNQTYHCTPWGMPTRNIFGWQKPCYLLGEGYVEDLQGADGDHRLGLLRHRPLREVRELHGALRLRADRRGRDAAPIRSQALKVALRGVAHRRRDGAGNLARRPAPGAIRVRRPGADRALPRSAPTRRREAAKAAPRRAASRRWTAITRRWKAANIVPSYRSRSRNRYIP